MEEGRDVWTILAANPPGEGFGFNGDLLDTNILNLAAVLGILIYFGGELVGSLLETRKQTILKSLQDAEERYQEALEKLQQAQAELVSAEAKAEEIRQQGRTSADLTVQQVLEMTAKEKARIEETKDTILGLEEEKAVAEVCRAVVRLALDKTKQKVQGRLTPGLSQRVTDLNIGLLGRLATVGK
uniref:ATP synthase subunit b, chloroplastic n=1 Tax=Nephroselmis pyriformis TaxID=156128 RepID=A0A8A2H8P6_9CHLO|nr:CF0 subunit I of ATP synthase [Nephroselmis pyriformis]QSV37310.1 CF0 subunit I of ATP synthase [Nephroselmis pyriformis]